GILPIANGGTNSSVLSNASLLSFNGTSIVGTSTPTVGTILATSTNATSTFAGGLSVSTLNVGSTTATSTFANGISLASGCFAVNGNCAGLFAYLFPNNATSTALAFNGGLTT